jgi:multidrug resistance efflux pump
MISTPFQLNAPARIEGAIQRIISAPADGYIDAVHVRPGDHVSKGQVLIELEDDALKLEHRKLEGEIAQLRSAYGTALASRNRGDLSVVLAQIEEAKARLALVEQQLTKVHLVAPFDAVVIDGDLTQALGAPINEGDKLLTLAPENEFRVIVDIDERDIRFLEPGFHGKLTLTASPQDRFDIEIRRVTPRAQVSEGNNVFPAEARIVDGPAALLRPGMEGVSRIDVGERSLLWTTLRRTIDWLQFRLWVWLG